MAAGGQAGYAPDCKAPQVFSENKTVTQKSYQDKPATEGEPDNCKIRSVFQQPEDVDLPRCMEGSLRAMRATAFALAARDCHPEDAAQLATAVLIDLSAGMPDIPGILSVKEEAQWWADLATPAELSEILAATLERLQSRALHRTMRKRLFMILWRTFTPKEQADFLAFANSGDKA